MRERERKKGKEGEGEREGVRGDQTNISPRNSGRNQACISMAKPL